jgi:hypothetical protein
VFVAAVEADIAAAVAVTATKAATPTAAIAERPILFELLMITPPVPDGPASRVAGPYGEYDVAAHPKVISVVSQFDHHNYRQLPGLVT